MNAFSRLRIPMPMLNAALTSMPRAARDRSEPVNAKRSSAMAQRPVVRDPVGERIEPFDLRRVMGDRGAVGDERGRHPLALEAVPHVRRHGDERVVQLADMELLQRAAAW